MPSKIHIDPEQKFEIVMILTTHTVNLLNQNKRRVFYNESISLLTLQYILFTNASLSQLKSQRLWGVILPKEELSNDVS